MNYDKLKSYTISFFKKTPVYFVKYTKWVVLFVVLVGVLLGAYKFYNDAYLAVNQEQEVIVSKRSVDKELLEEVVIHFIEEDESRISIPSNNPFQK